MSFWRMFNELRGRKTTEEVKEREREGVSRGFSLIESASGEESKPVARGPLYGGPFTREAGKFRR